MASKVATRRALVLCTLLLPACGVPIPGERQPDPVEAPTPGADVDTLVPLDEGGVVLNAQLQAIAARTTETRDLMHLVAAARSGGSDGAVDTAAAAAERRALGDDAVGLLLGPPAGGSGPGLLPAVTPDRGGTATEDLVTALITSAGDVGGDRSRLVLELVRDPLVGDLGAWQRDPIGVITLLEDVAAAHAAPGADPAALDAALLAIPGELTRALGYALTIAAAADPTVAAHAAERAIGHLDVVIIAIGLAIERIGGA